MVDRRVVQTRLTHISQQLDRLRRLPRVGQQQFLDDPDLQDLVLHRLQTAIQGCLDVASHIIADERLQVASTMPGLFDTLATHRIISRPLAQALKELILLRNVIVHEYADLDLKRVFTAWRRKPLPIRRFCQAIKRFAKL